MFISHCVDGCLKLPRLSPGPDLFPSCCAGLSLLLPRGTESCSGCYTQDVWHCWECHSGRLSGIPSHSKWDPKGNQVLEEELRTSACSGNRDFLHDKEMESEAVNVCPDLLDNNPGDRKHFTSKGDFSSLGRMQRRIVEAWIAVGLIPVSCPWAWGHGLYMFFSLSQLSFLAFLYTADNTRQYISWAPCKENHALEHEIIAFPGQLFVQFFIPTR